MSEALHHLGVKEALLGLREGRFTSEALVRDCLTHITQLDPTIEAWVWLKSEAALESARAADQHRRAGKQGALLGCRSRSGYRRRARRADAHGLAGFRKSIPVDIRACRAPLEEPGGIAGQT
jgi:hypothetical protein